MRTHFKPSSLVVPCQDYPNCDCKGHLVYERQDENLHHVYKSHDKELDVIAFNWGGTIEHSVELFDGQLLLDFNKDENIVGFELLDYKKLLEEGIQ